MKHKASPAYWIFLVFQPQSNKKKEERGKGKKKKKEEKEHRKQERKQNSNGGKLEDMLAYVDENGELSSTPPEIKQASRPTNR